MVHAFMTRIGDVQDRQARRLRRWLLDPPARSGRPHLRGGLSPAALRRVQLFVEAHLERPMTVRDLAARAGLSPSHFTRAFRATAGVTPRAFVEGRRLERARALIDGTDRSLSDIALACGFKTQSRLTVAFRRQTGFTPAAYRRGRPRARTTATRR
jgi:AraC family transcriptional regulator